jgi:hypothetical protein
MSKVMKRFCVWILLAGSLCMSCRNDGRQDDALRAVTQWLGRQIVFPDSLPCTAPDADAACIPTDSPHYKILMYVDSTGCISCKLRLTDWTRILHETDSLFGDQVDVLFFFQPKNEKELALIFRRDGFSLPVFLDRKSRLEQLNHFPATMEQRCFLLDQNNKVVLIGNPALNPKIWELYKQQIAGTAPDVRKAQTETEVTVDAPQHDLGTMQTGNTYTSTFALTNTGERPFAITDVKTSCGCTVPAWDGHPVAPGATATVSLNVTPDTPGAFHKTATVYGNTKKPLQLSVIGKVKE